MNTLSFSDETIENYEGHTLHRFEVDGREAIVVEPKNPRPEQEWVWKAEFFTAFPAFEIAMLEEGYTLAFLTVGNTFGCPDAMDAWDEFYDFLTKEHGFVKRPILLGLSRGGLYAYNWAARDPKRVACIYADNAVCDFKSWPGGQGKGPGSADDWAKLIDDYHFTSEAEALAYTHNPVDNLKGLVEAGIPLIHASATDDETVPIEENTDVLEARVKDLGGTITTFRHPGLHHPHGLEDPTPIVTLAKQYSAKANGIRL